MINNTMVMQLTPEQLAEIHSRVRAAGGIVHKDGNIFFTNADKFLLASSQPHQHTKSLIEECQAALAEELAGFDIDPPLHHVKQAHDKCVAWLHTSKGTSYCEACEQNVSGPCNSLVCPMPEAIALKS